VKATKRTRVKTKLAPTSRPERLKRKDYDKALAKRHVELVKLPHFYESPDYPFKLIEQRAWTKSAAPYPRAGRHSSTQR